MTQEEKQLLLQDLCARLPYGVVVTHRLNVDNVHGVMSDIDMYGNAYIRHYGIIKVEDVKPYLRPMSSMTEEEYKELNSISSYYGFAPYKYIGDWCPNYEMIDWLNKHHFDYRGLIPMGLALQAPKGMYKKC